MSIYCLNCGAELPDDSKFCHNCGASIEPTKKAPVTETPEEREPYPYEQEYQPPPAKPESKAGIAAVAVIAIVVIASLAVIVPLSILLASGPFTYTFLGTTSYTYESTAILDVNLDIKNNLGEITIEYDNSLSDLFEATINVYGRKEATMVDAVNFTDQISGGKVMVAFDSGENWTFWDKKSLKYDLEISINPDANVEYALECTTGGINLDFDNAAAATTTINALDLECTTGSISVVLWQTNITTPSISFVTTTGEVDLDFTDTVVYSTEVSVQATTGDISIVSKDVAFQDDIDWDIDTTTGGIRLEVTQSTLPAESYTATYDIEATTGRIRVECDIDETLIGVKFTADVTTGSINLPGGYDIYQSTDYDLKLVKYYFDMETTTGSVTATN